MVHSLFGVVLQFVCPSCGTQSTFAETMRLVGAPALLTVGHVQCPCHRLEHSAARLCAQNLFAVLFVWPGSSCFHQSHRQKGLLGHCLRSGQYYAVGLCWDVVYFLSICS
jgi:hypothetical protein